MALGRVGREFFTFSCVLCRSKGGVDAYAPEAAVLSLDVLGEGQAILPCIFQQELAELLLRNRRFQIILAPLGVGAVEIGGALLYDISSLLAPGACPPLPGGCGAAKRPSGREMNQDAPQ